MYIFTKNMDLIINCSLLVYCVHDNAPDIYSYKYRNIIACDTNASSFPFVETVRSRDRIHIYVVWCVIRIVARSISLRVTCSHVVSILSSEGVSAIIITWDITSIWIKHCSFPSLTFPTYTNDKWIDNIVHTYLYVNNLTWNFSEYKQCGLLYN